MAPHVQVSSGRTYWGRMVFQKSPMRVRPGLKPSLVVRLLVAGFADSKVAMPLTDVGVLAAI